MARAVGLAAALLSALLPPQPCEATAGTLAELRQLGTVGRAGSMRPSGSEAARSELAPPLARACDSSSSEPCGAGWRKDTNVSSTVGVRSKSSGC